MVSGSCIRDIFQGDIIPVGHFFRIKHRAFALLIDIEIIQLKCIPLHIYVEVRTHALEHAFPVHLDLERADGDLRALFACFRRSAGCIPALLAGQALRMQNRDFRPVHSRILIDLNAFLTDFPVGPVTALFKICQIHGVGILFQPRVCVKCMIAQRQILEIKTVQMTPGCFELIPDSQEFHVLMLRLLHVMLLHLIIRRKILRQRRAVFALRRIPDIIIRDQRITGAGFMLRLLMEIDGPDLPVVIQVQYGLTVRCHHCIITAGIIKAVIIPVILRIREPVRHLAGTLDILF